MRKLPLGVAISMIVHAVVLAWVAARWHAAPPKHNTTPPPEPTIEIVEVAATPPPSEPPAMEVMLLDEPVASAPPPPASSPTQPAPLAESPPLAKAPPASPAAVAITSAPTTSAETAPANRGADAPPPGTGSAAPARDGMLAMRRSATGVPQLRAELPAGQWDAYEHAPKGTAPEVEIHGGQLRDHGAAGKLANQGVFVGKVNPDGTVKITDSANLNVHFALPSPGAIATGLQSWYYNDKTLGGTGSERDGTHKVNEPLAKSFQVTPGASTNPGGEGQPQAHEPTVIVPILAGGFDVTDALMRSHGIDPYASKKLKFLDSTRDERVQIGNKHRAEQLARAPQLMQHNLDALWASRLDLAARKRALFELWDDCAETGDPAVVAAGQAARRLVIGFIRGHLAAGAADAYTVDEIAALARHQQSKAAFQPYEP